MVNPIYILIGLILFTAISYMLFLVYDYHQYAKRVQKILNIVYRNFQTLSKIKGSSITKYNWENNLTEDSAAREIAANGHYSRRVTDEHEENSI